MRSAACLLNPDDRFPTRTQILTNKSMTFRYDRYLVEGGRCAYDPRPVYRPASNTAWMIRSMIYESRRLVKQRRIVDSEKNIYLVIAELIESGEVLVRSAMDREAISRYINAH